MPGRKKPKAGGSTNVTEGSTNVTEESTTNVSAESNNVTLSINKTVVEDLKTALNNLLKIPSVACNIQQTEVDSSDISGVLT